VSLRRSEEIAQLAAEVQRFARAKIDAAAIERAGRIPDDVIAGLAELGLFGMTLPAEYGGAGLSLGDACAIVEELAVADRSVATMLGLHVGLGTRAIASLAPPDVAREAVGRLASGEWIGSFAATEAGAGSDLMAVRTAARVEGDAVVVDGEKSYVTNGRLAGCYTVLARTGARAHALVMVPRATPGVSVGAEEHKLGIRASSTVTVTFSGARVPASHVLGPIDGGLEGAYRVLAWGRTLMSAGCVGTARAALDATLAHVTTRTQFRRTLSEQPAVKAHVADMAAMTFASRAMVDASACAVAADDGAEARTLATKVFASERTFEVCDMAIQLHGALGVIEDVGVARLARDCRVTRIFEGANDVLRLRIAAARLTGRAPAPRVGDGAALATDAAQACDAIAARIDGACNVMRKEYGAAFVTRQGPLLRLARAEIAHLAAVTALDAASEDDADLARFAAERLTRDAGVELDALRDAARVDELSAKVAQRLYPGRSR
jgi:acyl-CoA dehydrogenase